MPLLMRRRDPLESILEWETNSSVTFLQLKLYVGHPSPRALPLQLTKFFARLISHLITHFVARQVPALASKLAVVFALRIHRIRLPG